MDRPLERGERLDALIAHLRANESASMGEIASALGVSVRTVRRDVDALRRRGMQIEGERGRGGGIRFSRFAPLPPLRLEEQQAVGLWLSVQVARRVAGLPFSRENHAGLSKVIAALPDERRQSLHRLFNRIVIGNPSTERMAQSVGEMCPTLLDTFERCFRNGVCMGFRYVDRLGAPSVRQVEPHGILVRLPLWYVLAVDIEKDAQRMFRMDRISHPRVLRRRFEPSMQVVEEMMSDVPCTALGDRRA